QIFALATTITHAFDGVMAAPPKARQQEFLKQEPLIGTTWKDLIQTRKDLMEIEHDRYQTNIESKPEMQVFLKTCINHGVVFSLAVAAGLLYMFSTYITSRLTVLSSNALLFARKQPMLPPMTGSDEVCRLDKTLHEMADAITLAEARKQ